MIGITLLYALLSPSIPLCLHSASTLLAVLKDSICRARIYFFLEHPYVVLFLVTCPEYNSDTSLIYLECASLLYRSASMPIQTNIQTTSICSRPDDDNIPEHDSRDLTPTLALIVPHSNPSLDPCRPDVCDLPECDGCDNRAPQRGRDL